MKHVRLETTPAISKRMANVHLKGGKAETLLAKELWHCGIRYRLNDRRFPGSPDISITKDKIAIFVDGEFWHGKDWEERKKKLKNNRDYWIAKIEENIERDMRNDHLLKEIGWIPLHFWEKEVIKNLKECVEKVLMVVSERKKFGGKTKYVRSVRNDAEPSVCLCGPE